LLQVDSTRSILTLDTLSFQVIINKPPSLSTKKKKKMQLLTANRLQALVVSLLLLGTVNAAPVPSKEVALYSSQISTRGFFSNLCGKLCGGSSTTSPPTSPTTTSSPAAAPSIPTTAEILAALQKYGTVANKDSIFYSGNQGAGSVQSQAQTWYKDNVPGGRGAVSFNDIDATAWYQAMSRAAGLAGGSAVDKVGKRASQAFAEAVSGDVYFFTPAGTNAANTPTTTTWGGWEYPALTRNANVARIIQVAPGSTTTSVIWKHGDPPSAVEPKGDSYP
jgi:hypothetical protein